MGSGGGEGPREVDYLFSMVLALLLLWKLGFRVGRHIIRIEVVVVIVVLTSFNDFPHEFSNPIIARNRSSSIGPALDDFPCDGIRRENGRTHLIRATTSGSSTWRVHDMRQHFSKREWSCSRRRIPLVVAGRRQSSSRMVWRGIPTTSNSGNCGRGEGHCRTVRTKKTKKQTLVMIYCWVNG